MFIDTNSIKLYTSASDNTGLSVGEYLTEAKYAYNKLWGANSGRNLNGTQTGTLVGIFPKITLSFRKLSKSELETLVPYLDKAHQYIRYYDPKKRSYVKMKTYTGDYEITNKRIIDSKRKNEAFNISFISVKKRS